MCQYLRAWGNRNLIEAVAFPFNNERFGSDNSFVSRNSLLTIPCSYWQKEKLKEEQPGFFKLRREPQMLTLTPTILSNVLCQSVLGSALYKPVNTAVLGRKGKRILPKQWPTDVSGPGSFFLR